LYPSWENIVYDITGDISDETADLWTICTTMLHNWYVTFDAYLLSFEKEGYYKWPVSAL
jgi:hypothetical protein